MAVGCQEAEIAKSIVFVADGDPVVCVASGRHRIDTGEARRRARRGRGAPGGRRRGARRHRLRDRRGAAVRARPAGAVRRGAARARARLGRRRRPAQPVRGRPARAGALRGRARGGRGRRRRLASPAYKRPLPNPVQRAKDIARAWTRPWRHGDSPQRAARARDSDRLGDGRRDPRDVHAGRLPVPGDRLLAHEERRARSCRRSWPTSRSPRSATGRSASRSPSAAPAGSRARTAPSSAPATATCSRRWRSRTAAVPAKFFFQFVFCAVSLAIVWGTTIERIKFGAYLIYAVVFSSLIYPIISHWIFGGGWLAANIHMQDFAGSTVVHLIGATGALAALLLLGPRDGKYGKDGSPNVIPGHNMPLVGPGGAGALVRLVRLQRRLDAGRDRRPLRRCGRGHQPGCRRGRARGDAGQPARRARPSTSAWPATARSRRWWRSPRRRATSSTGPAPIIGGVAGLGVVFCIIAIDKVLDDPVGALSAHGVAGIWGTLSCGLFTAPAAGRRTTASASGGLFYTRLLRAARQPGARRRGGLHVRVRRQLRGLLGDQAHLRPARERRGGAPRARHRRARHVGLPRAVHAGARIRVPPAEHSRGQARRRRCRLAARTQEG